MTVKLALVGKAADAVPHALGVGVCLEAGGADKRGEQEKEETLFPLLLGCKWSTPRYVHRKR